METADIDNRLRHYRDIERQWADSLYDLDEHPTYRLLAAGAMAGVTGQQANALVSQAPHLWGWLGMLRTQLDQVDELRKDRGIFGHKGNGDSAILLTQASIPLLRSSIPGEAPRFALEALAPAADHDMVLASIDTLIALFRSVYEPVRDVVARVDSVWRDLLPRIEAAETALARAEAMCARLGMRVSEVLLARQRVDAVRASVADDPLSLSSNVGPDLDALVAGAVVAAGSIEQAHGNLDSDLAATDAQIAQLRVLRARAAAAFSEAEAKVVPTTKLVRVPSPAVIDGAGGLAHRATQIVRAPGDWQLTRNELDRWNHAAQRLRQQLERALDVNTAPIRRRDELRGLLRAYRSKASATLGLPAAVLERGQAAHDELYTRPADLAHAEELIDQFSKELRGET